MSTITNYTDKSQPCEVEATYQMKNEAVLDFTTVPCVSGDVVQALQIPAGAFVSNVGIKVLTAEANTVQVGDGSDADGWDANVNTGSTGVTIGDGQYITDGGKYYAAADTIDLTIASDMSSGKIAVFASYFLLEN